MLSSPHRDERDAYLFADLAAAHEAGLTVEEIMSGPSTAGLRTSRAATVRSGNTLAEGLVDGGVELRPHELVTLQTAEDSGNLGPALRNLSVRRTARAQRHREVRRRLAYPLFLLVFGTGASVVASTVTGANPWLPILCLGAALTAVWLFVRRVQRTAGSHGKSRIPMLTDLVLDMGELPYLESIHGLYSAGVKLIEAHELAQKTVPVDGVRARLETVGEGLAAGNGFAESIHKAGVLHPETRQMLASAEVAGDLEAALGRAIQRRQDSFDLRARRLTTILVTTILILVYGFVIYIVFSFYSGYFARLGLGG